MNASKTSLHQDLEKHASELTRRNMEGDDSPPGPPAITAESPLLELLINDLVRLVPRPIAERIRTATSLREAEDWLGAAALLQWIRGDQIAESAFLKSLRDNPKEAGLALSRAVSSHLEPPERSQEWHQADRAGFVVQLLAAAALLLARGALFCMLAETALNATSVLHNLLAVDLMALPVHSFTGIAKLMIAICWLLCIEVWCCPRFFEFCRQAPARLNILPPPVSWRIDTFPFLWRMQSVALAAAIGALPLTQ